MLPIINGSPTVSEHLYAAMTEAEKIKDCVFKEWKTINSFHLQLHIKAVMLQQRPDICSGFVFRMENFMSCSVRWKSLENWLMEVVWNKPLKKQFKSVLSEKQDIRFTMSLA